MRRPLLLTGFMASGKTTVGRAAASLAGVPFEDLDERIESEAGVSIADLFRRDGEDSFRARERTLLDQTLADPTPRVVALGGGALLSRQVRLRALSLATVVSLSAPLNVLCDRLRDDPRRPLVGEPGGFPLLEELYVSRGDGYAEAHAVIDTSRCEVEAVARQVLAVSERDPLVVALGARTYPVDVSTDDLALLAVVEAARATGILVVTDRSVYPHVRPWLEPALGSRLLGAYVLEPGERSKSLESLVGGWLAAREHGLDRRGLIIGIGGGVVTDVAGLLASTWLRGIRWIAVPTSVLSVVDAAIGGKTGIDFGSAKNAVGAFHQPIGVCANVRRVQTEPRRSFRAGLAEVVKVALIGDDSLLDRLEQHADRLLEGDPDVVLSCLRAGAAVKTAIVSRDEREGGERVLLNLGHTLGHALEAAGGFGRWLHGEAVSLGTVGELRAGAALGITPPTLVDRVTVLLDRFGLPTSLRRRDVEEAMPFLSHDKKREGEHVRGVLVEAPGRAIVRLLPRSEWERAFLAAAR